MLCVVALRDVLPWVLCVVLCARVRECVASLSLCVCVCVLFVRARDALSVIACACVRAGVRVWVAHSSLS